MAGLGIRWTIGDVAARGFHALALSIHGAVRLFGPRARYCVCVNTLAVDEARRRTGPVPGEVEWRAVEEGVPAWLVPHLDRGMAQGTAWKFAPLRAFPEVKELSLDNDCILWNLPRALGEWLEDDSPRAVLLAEDVRRCLGQFSDDCGPRPLNLGIRGVGPGFDLESSLRERLRARPVRLSTELDEQGLQVAALTHHGELRVVPVEDVSIASPFPPHLPWLGACGAHFCGLNSRNWGWVLEGRPASEHVAAFWDARVDEVRRRVGLEGPEEARA